MDIRFRKIFTNICLVLGLVFIIFSFFIYCFDIILFSTVFMAGSGLTLFSLIVILFGKRPGREKWKVFGIMAVFIVAYLFSENFLNKSSYLIYLGLYEDDLNKGAQILNKYDGDITVTHSGFDLKENAQLASRDSMELSDLVHKLPFYEIIKSDGQVVFIISHYFFTHTALAKSTNGKRPKNRLANQPLRNDWYY